MAVTSDLMGAIETIPPQYNPELKADKSELPVAGEEHGNQLHIVERRRCAPIHRRANLFRHALDLCSRRVGESSWRKKIRNVKARHVGHSIMKIEAVR